MGRGEPKESTLEDARQARQEKEEKGKEKKVLFGRRWEQVKGVERGIKKGDRMERGVSKKMQEIIGEEREVKA